MGDTLSDPMSERLDHQLVKELVEVGRLDKVDACRSAFIVLAVSSGWSKARIARYLGISRARVGQKLERCRAYATREGADVLDSLVGPRVRLPDPDDSVDGRPVVSFDASDWEDQEFANGLLEMILDAYEPDTKR